MRDSDMKVTQCVLADSLMAALGDAGNEYACAFRLRGVE
jgi:hypothetical protein